MFETKNFKIHHPRLKAGPLAGFTLVELMVAVSILAIMAGLIIVNFTGTRVDRNLTIAQNELVTNIRKAQAYTLSSRLVAGNQPAQVFVLKFDNDASARSSYTLQAMYDVSSSPQLVPSVETYQLPPGVYLSTSSPVTVYRDPLKYTANVGGMPAGTQNGPCTLIAFKTPFAKVFFNGAGDPPPSSSAVSGSGCYRNAWNATDDDYAHILNHVTNVAGYPTTTDYYAVITLTDVNGTKTKKVMVRGVTGVVCPTNDDVNCSN